MRLIVSDLDGTLLDKDARLADETRAALQAAVARGVALADRKSVV